jgi:hypothetical protein
MNNALGLKPSGAIIHFAGRLSLSGPTLPCINLIIQTGEAGKALQHLDVMNAFHFMKYEKYLLTVVSHLESNSLSAI